MTRPVAPWYDAHARALYLVALAVAGDVDAALEAVAVGVGTAERTEGGPNGSSAREWRRILGRGVYDACAARAATPRSDVAGAHE